MDSPLVFLLGIIAVAFVLWFAGGGQHWAISYQGPYITPITNEGQTQVGYGPQLFGTTTISLPGSSVSAGTNSAKSSPYTGSITFFRSTEPASNNPNLGYLEFAVSSKASSPIVLTNWKFASVATQSAVLITNSGAVIQPGQTILVVTRFPSRAHDTIELYDANGGLVSSVSF